jgi:soluble epoxide hydrolase / lipid-phosphate phosphatase
VYTEADSVFSVMYADEALSNREFYPPGALEAFLSANQHLPLPPCITPEEKATRSDIFSCSPGPIFAGRSTIPSDPSSTDLPPGYHGPTNWYRALVNNLAVAEEKADGVDPRIKCPVLMITETPGEATIPLYADITAQFAADYRSRKVSTKGHWVQLEAREEVNAMLEEFFAEIQGAAEAGS